MASPGFSTDTAVVDPRTAVAEPATTMAEPATAMAGPATAVADRATDKQMADQMATSTTSAGGTIDLPAAVTLAAPEH
jgi:hypothetical protein